MGGKGEDTLNLGNTPPSSGHVRQTFMQISYRQKIKLTKTILGYNIVLVPGFSSVTKWKNIPPPL